MIDEDLKRAVMGDLLLLTLVVNLLGDALRDALDPKVQ